MIKKINVGLIGAGRIGRLHAENIQSYIPRMTLKKVTDPHLDWNWANQFSIIGDVNAETILDDPSIDAVLICSPADTHVPLIIAAANAKKHIFCEKPISLDLDAILKALECVEKNNVHLQVGFNRRFDPQFAAVAKAIATGKIGKPHLCSVTSRDPCPPPVNYIAQSGGLFLDMTIHDFDMCRFLFDDEIVEVYATAENRIDPSFATHNDVDTAVIQLRFKSGALGIIDNSREAVYGYDQRVEVFGSIGSMSVDHITATNTRYSTSEGILFEKPLYFFLERYQHSYIEELNHFCDVILNHQPCDATGYDGLMSVVIGLAAKQSLLEKKPIAIADHLPISYSKKKEDFHRV